jgi:Putative bacterial sensory transduction regulator
MKRLLLASIALLASNLLAVAAQPATLTPQTIRKSLASAGYGAELVQTDNEGRALIRTGSDMRTAMHLYGCTKARCTSVLLRTFLKNSKLQIGDLNRINAAMRFIKVYLDDDGDVAIEMDVDLARNATAAIPAASLKRFEEELSRMLTKHAAPAGARSGRTLSQGQDI